MSDHPVGEGRDDRPPSARARAELSAGVASDVADARLALQEAVLRAEGHRLLGDGQGLQVALADQDRILQELQERLGRTTSTAILQRDAEEVVAAATSVGDLDLADVPDDVRLVTLDDTPAPAAPRHAPLLSGVASVIALVAVAGAIVLGTGQGTPAPGVLEVAGQVDDVERSDTPTDATAVPDTAPGTHTDRPGSPTDSSAGSTQDAPMVSSSPTELAAEGGDDAAPRTLERIVQDLNEVVSRFGVDPQSRLDLPVEDHEDGTDADDDPGTQPGDAGTDGDDADDGDEDDEDDRERSRLGGFVQGDDDE